MAERGNVAADTEFKVHSTDELRQFNAVFPFLLSPQHFPLFRGFQHFYGFWRLIAGKMGVPRPVRE